MTTSPTVNLGILAHVDAGKTSLTERLLYAAGVIDAVGRVDDGSTQTDTLALERQRGITIKAAVVSFRLGEVTVNLIDTPGHADFIGEVERALSVLDGAVLVVSAVEGVQAQTRVLTRVLRRLSIPTLIFVNKIDRMGARPSEVLQEISDLLTPAVIAMGSVRAMGTRAAGVAMYDDLDAEFHARLGDLLVDHDEGLLADLLADDALVTPNRMRQALRRQTQRSHVHPVYFGSALTGAGLDGLSRGIADLLPVAAGTDDGPMSAAVFKVDRDTAGHKVAYVRMFAGALRVRDRLPAASGERERVTGLRVFADGTTQPRAVVSAGQIAQLSGPARLRIGDVIGVAPDKAATAAQFSPPTMETVVDAVEPHRRGALHAALTELADQDPLIGVRRDAQRQELSVSLYGEVQQEVIQATLAAEYGVEVTFRPASIICVERVVGTGEAFEVIDTESNPFLATVGLRIEPNAAGSGVGFGLEVELGSMPPAFFVAVEEAARATLRQGLHGWDVSDCHVTMTHSGYWARQSHAHGSFDASMSSTAGDFRKLTPMVLMAALRKAGTGVHEPMVRADLEVPADSLGAIVALIGQLEGQVDQTEPRGSSYALSAVLPATQVRHLHRDLRALTNGEGVVVSAFSHYRRVKAEPPRRARTDADPLDRRAYLLSLSRRFDL